MSSSVPGLLSRPSCGKTQISRSMAHLYSSMSGWIPSRLRSPPPDPPPDGSACGGALQDALLQRLHRALAHLVGLEVPLGLRHLGDGLLQRSLDGLAAVEQAGLVQVDVGLDEAGRDQASPEVDLLAFGGEPGLDGGDAPALDPDVDRRLVLGADDQRISENQVHGVLPSGSSDVSRKLGGAGNGSILLALAAVTLSDPSGRVRSRNRRRGSRANPAHCPELFSSNDRAYGGGIDSPGVVGLPRDAGPVRRCRRESGPRRRCALRQPPLSGGRSAVPPKAGAASPLRLPGRRTQAMTFAERSAAISRSE